MFKNTKRGLGAYKKDYGSDDAYKYYKDMIDLTK